VKKIADTKPFPSSPLVGLSIFMLVIEMLSAGNVLAATVKNKGFYINDLLE